MHTAIPQKLLKIAADIDACGDVPLTRLTVLKKWLEPPGRLAGFVRWVGLRAIAEKGRAGVKAGRLFREAKAMLTDLEPGRPVGGAQGRALFAAYQHVRDFQNVYKASRWGEIRTIQNWNLFLAEKSLWILCRPAAAPTEGYKLAADHCQNYDPRYGNGLNGPSKDKILEIARWMSRFESLENAGPTTAHKRSRQSAV